MFSVYIPAAQGDGKKGAVHGDDTHAGTFQEEQTMSIAMVLLVDDEVPFVETMTKRLTKRDLEIIPALQRAGGLGEAR